VSGAPRAPDRAAAPVSVVDARVCRTLSTAGPGDWDCAPANTVDAPGTFFFYTRLKSAADTTVEHRWYRGGRLHQTVELAIQASPVSGFRTYSRQTVGAHRGGDWRVEVRTKDGELLDEARFTVR
jgi:hypothetical protein